MGRLLTIAILLLATISGYAQQEDSTEVVRDSIAIPDVRILLPADTVSLLTGDSASTVVADQKKRNTGTPRDWNTWKPDPQRALWLALVVPGAGQIYNRKYWKLPIIYGGFMGCIYALTWNNMMYKDYSQAYLDITDPSCFFK